MRDEFIFLPGIREIVSWVCKLRGEDIANQLEMYLDKTGQIVDVGCGTNGVANALIRRGYNVVGVDIKKINLFSAVPFVVADGENLPFKDDTFCVCILHTTLHHTRNPLKIILEGKRIAKRLVITEELVNEKKDRLFMSIYDSIINASIIDHPHNNDSDNNWKLLFEYSGLKLIAVCYNKIFGFINQAIYILE